jgi:hypothetical protein
MDDDIVNELNLTAQSADVGFADWARMMRRAANEIEWVRAERDSHKSWIIRESIDIRDPYVMLPYVLMRLTHKGVYMDYGRFETKEAAEYVRDALSDIV